MNMTSTANQVEDGCSNTPAEEKKGLDIEMDIPKAGQRRKRARTRRKRKIGKASYLGPRKITDSDRAQNVRSAMFAHGQPVAPYNTTQFLIEDHGDLQILDAQLRKPPGIHRNYRNRDSSFSIDSDDDYFYSSPDDEEEFLSREFSLEYEDLHVERLNALSKSDIIRDYLQLEGKFEKSMIELQKIKGGEQIKTGDSGRDTDASSRSDADVNEQLRLANIDNRRLKIELEKLKRENAQLRMTHREIGLRGDSASSEDSESDSSSSSSVSSSSEDTSSESRSSSPEPPQESTTTKVSEACQELKAVSVLSEDESTGANKANLPNVPSSESPDVQEPIAPPTVG